MYENNYVKVFVEDNLSDRATVYVSPKHPDLSPFTLYVERAGEKSGVVAKALLKSIETLTLELTDAKVLSPKEW